MDEQLKLTFDPEYTPDAINLMQLASLVKMPGWPVEQKIMKAIVDTFLVDARNANTADPLDCQEKLRKAQVAAQFYQEFADRVSMLVGGYSTAEAKTFDGEVAPDPTKALDMGGLDFSELDNFPNLFSIEDGFEEGLPG